MDRIRIEYMATDRLIPYVNNPRKNDKAVDVVAGSIQEFGFKNPIIVDKDNVIVAGHTRLLAARKLELEEVPVIRAEDLTEQQIKAFRLADNKTAEFAEWDMELLALELEGLDDIFTGFNEVEIADILGLDNEAQEDDFDVDAEAEKIIEPETKPGDVWLLGRHRLMCGDATKKEDVERLMDGKKADMVFTDPPYGIEVVGGTKPFGTVGGTNKVKVNRYSPIIGDDTVSTAKDFYLLAVELGVENFVIWGGNYFTEFLPPRKCWIVWDKKGREWDDNFSDFEMAWTSYEKPAKIFTHVWMGMVQGGKREKRVHPTQKPAELVGKIFNYLLTENDMVILDGFGGSGSTLIACEQLNRTCYMMELDPIYGDVIIKRWENFTGEKAVLLDK